MRKGELEKVVGGRVGNKEQGKKGRGRLHDQGWQGLGAGSLPRPTVLVLSVRLQPSNIANCIPRLSASRPLTKRA